MDTQQRSNPQPQQQQSPQQQRPQSQTPQQPISPLRRWINWLLLVALIAWNIFLFLPAGQPPTATVPYSTFVSEVQAGNVQQVSIQGAQINGTFIQPVPANLLSASP